MRPQRRRRGKRKHRASDAHPLHTNYWHLTRLWYNPHQTKITAITFMKFKMHERSLFATLLRNPWWVSLGVAILIALLSRLFLSGDFRIFGFTMAVPFAVIAAITLRKQLQAPSGARVTAVLTAVQAMSWREFSTTVEAALVRDGFNVKPLKSGGADFEIAQGLSKALVSCKRWKAASHGLAQLEELVALSKERDATEAMYISIAPLTENAQRYAVEQRMRLINGVDLVQFLRDLPIPPQGKV